MVLVTFEQTPFGRLLVWHRPHRSVLRAFFAQPSLNIASIRDSGMFFRAAQPSLKSSRLPVH
jgi:hypothetical protein